MVPPIYSCTRQANWVAPSWTNQVVGPGIKMQLKHKRFMQFIEKLLWMIECTKNCFCKVLYWKFFEQGFLIIFHQDNSCFLADKQKLSQVWLGIFYSFTNIYNITVISSNIAYIGLPPILLFREFFKFNYKFPGKLQKVPKSEK